MKNLFLYYLKKRIPALVILAIGFSILTIIYNSQSEFIRYQNMGDKITSIPGDNPFIYLCVVFCFIATVTPVLEFSFKMKRRSIDLFYSLPIKRIKLYTVKYIFGLLEVFILCSLQWFISYIYVLSHENVFNLYIYFIFGLVSIVVVLLIYTFLVFFFTMGNSLIDGIFNMVMASCLLPCIIHIFYLIFARFQTNISLDMFYMRYYFLYSPLFDISFKQYYAMCGSYFDGNFYEIHWIAVVLLAILCVASGVLFFILNYKRNKAENVSDDSDTFFSYRFFIPAYMITGFTVAGRFSPFWVIIAMGGYLVYAIFRKNFKIKKRDLFAYGISLLIGLVIASIL